MAGVVTMRPEPSELDMLHIAQRLRARDREEIFATSWNDDPEVLAKQTAQTGPFRWGFYLDGTPVAAMGATPRWPRVWNVWAYGTDDWPKVVRAMTKHARRFMIPALDNAGIMRADCMALSSHTDARRWLESFGLRPENVLDNWGKNGEEFVCYSWTRKATQDHVRPSTT